MKKVVLITNIPNPYRLPLFNKLNVMLNESGYSFVVIFGAKTYDRRKFVLDENDFRFKYRVLDSSIISLTTEKTTFDYKNLSTVLKEENPDVIISSGFSAATVKALLFAFMNKRKLIIWNGSITEKRKGLSLLRSIQRKIIVRFADAFIAYGSRSAHYLESIGAKKSSVFIGLNTVDTDFFRTKTAVLKALSKKNDNYKHLTFVGYLSERKKVDVLFGLMIELNKLRGDVQLDIIGDGDDRIKLMEKVKSLKIENIVFHGFKQKDELPDYFAKTDLFLFQTGFDIWGLVLNEAMAAGLTCLASKEAGAVDDLIKENTGFLVNFNDSKQTAELINKLLNDERLLAEIGKNASDYISREASIEKSAAGFVSAIKHSLSVLAS